MNTNLIGQAIIKQDTFNGGGQLRVSLNMTGGSTAGYYNWSDVINEMGVLNFTFDNVFKVRLLQVELAKAKAFMIQLHKYGDGSDGPNYKRRLTVPSKWCYNR